jgi:hypothetical protein
MGLRVCSVELSAISYISVNSANEGKLLYLKFNLDSGGRLTVFEKYIRVGHKQTSIASIDLLCIRLSNLIEFMTQFDSEPSTA